MAWQTQKVPFPIDGTALASAVAVSSDAVVGSAVETGKGLFAIEFTVASYVAGTGFDTLVIIVQANTRAATTTWVEIGNLVLGDATGRGTELLAVTSAIVPVLNNADYQIRVYAYINGSTVSATVTATVYPFETRAAGA
jgi:hypothetical protein